MLKTLLLLSPFVLSDAFFTQITDAIHLGDDVYVVSTLSGDYHAHVFDAKSDTISRSIIRNGAGPEEARGIKHVADCGDDTVVFMSPGGKVLHYSYGLEFIAEYQTIYISTNSLHCNKGRLTLGYTSFFRSEQLQTDEKFIVGVAMDLGNIKEVTEIRLRGSDLYLGPKLRFNNLPILGIEFFVAETDPETYLIAIKGSPIIYLKGEELITYKFEDEMLAKSGHVEIRRDGYYGQRNGAVNLNWQTNSVEDETVWRFYFGSDNSIRSESEKMPFGYLEVDTESGLAEDYKLFDDLIQQNLSELEYHYTSVKGENTALLFRGFDLNANYIYLTEKFD